MEKLIVSDNIVSDVKNNLIPLYNTLVECQNEINKASVLAKLNLDDGMVLKHANDVIQNELNSIEKIQNMVKSRLENVDILDRTMANSLDEYYIDLEKMEAETTLNETPSEEKEGKQEETKETEPTAKEDEKKAEKENTPQEQDKKTDEEAVKEDLKDGSKTDSSSSEEKDKTTKNDGSKTTNRSYSNHNSSGSSGSVNINENINTNTDSSVKYLLSKYGEEKLSLMIKEYLVEKGISFDSLEIKDNKIILGITDKKFFFEDIDSLLKQFGLLTKTNGFMKGKIV